MVVRFIVVLDQKNVVKVGPSLTKLSGSVHGLCHPSRVKSLADNSQGPDLQSHHS